MKILVVDDEESLCEILQFNLEVEGFEADVAYSAEQALEMDLSGYSLILLDVMMGQMSGFKMGQILKKNPATAHIPIIFCTAKDTEDDTVAGLMLGADDYITKPFSVREVVARVKTVLRRTASRSGSDEHSQEEPAVKQDTEHISFEGLEVDLNKFTCHVDGEEVPLTKKEMDMLILFLKNRGKVLSREDILHRVWSDEVVVLDRTIDVNITRLRKKIGKYGQYIITRQGYGYGFEV